MWTCRTCLCSYIPTLLRTYSDTLWPFHPGPWGDWGSSGAWEPQNLVCGGCKDQLCALIGTDMPTRIFTSPGSGSGGSNPYRSPNHSPPTGKIWHGWMASFLSSFLSSYVCMDRQIATYLACEIMAIDATSRSSNASYQCPAAKADGEYCPITKQRTTNSIVCPWRYLERWSTIRRS